MPAVKTDSVQKSQLTNATRWHVTCRATPWGYGSCEEGYADWPDFSYGIWFVAKRLSQQPYTPADIEHSMCVWVSGHGCWGDHATGYRDRGLWLMGLLE